MSLFRKVLLGTGAVLVLLAVVGFLLPRNAHVERSISINASRATVFTIVNSFTHFNKWSPWAVLDPNAKYTYEGPAAGVGAKMSWVGDPATMGSGSHAVVASEPWGSVKTDIDFGPQGKATGTHTLTSEGQGTKVVWGLDTDLGLNPVSRYFGLMFDKMIGGDFERGLAGLKKLAESMPRGDFSGLTIEPAEAVSRTVLYTSASTSRDDKAVGDALAKAYGEIGAFIKANKLAITSMPIAIMTKSTDAGYEFQPAIPIEEGPAKPIPAGSPIQLKQTYAGKALKVTHTGSYTTLPSTYDKVLTYLAAHGIQGNGQFFYEWVDDPTKVQEAELRTFIWVPIK